MTTSQAIAYYTGALITSTIIFFILRAISIFLLEKKHKKSFSIKNPNATPQEMEIDFKNYFKTIRQKFYIILIVVTILIYVVLHK